MRRRLFNGYRTLRFDIVTKEFPAEFGITIVNLDLPESLVDQSRELVLIPQNKCGVKIESVDEGLRGDLMGIERQ